MELSIVMLAAMYILIAIIIVLIIVSLFKPRTRDKKISEDIKKIKEQIKGR